MKGKGTLIFVIVAIVITVAAVLYFVLKKPSNVTGSVKKGPGKKGASGGGGAGYTYTNTDIGKDAYASNDGVKVYSGDKSLYKTAAADEWVGKVYSTTSVHIPGVFDPISNTWSSGVDIQAYILGSDPKYSNFVDVNDVYLS